MRTYTELQSAVIAELLMGGYSADSVIADDIRVTLNYRTEMRFPFIHEGFIDDMHVTDVMEDVSELMKIQVDFPFDRASKFMDIYEKDYPFVTDLRDDARVESFAEKIREINNFPEIFRGKNPAKGWVAHVWPVLPMRGKVGLMNAMIGLSKMAAE